jgi:plasmid stability protein
MLIIHIMDRPLSIRKFPDSLRVALQIQCAKQQKSQEELIVELLTKALKGVK